MIKINNYIICDNSQKTIGEDLLEIYPIGYGSAFATVEGNSSFYIIDSKTEKSLLLDCGSLVYKSLRYKELTNKVDWVFITHTHEDHIGSLSTLIYENFFIHGRVLNIICASEIYYDINNYLQNICHHKPEQYNIMRSYKDEEFCKDFPSFDLKVYNTTGKHFPNLPSYAVSLKLKEIDFEVVFSGDIGVSIADELKLDKERLNQGKYLVFQDAGTFRFPETHLIPPHAHFEDCDYPNTFLYHHLEHEVDVINNNCKFARSVGSIVENGYFKIKK